MYTGIYIGSPPLEVMSSLLSHLLK